MDGSQGDSPYNTHPKWRDVRPDDLTAKLVAKSRDAISRSRALLNTTSCNIDSDCGAGFLCAAGGERVGRKRGRDRDASGTRTDIANHRTGTHNLQRRLNQQLSLRPRNQHIRRHAKRAPVKILCPGDVLRRLTRASPCDRVFKPLQLIDAKQIFGMTDQKRPVFTGDVRQQRTRLTPRFRHAALL